MFSFAASTTIIITVAMVIMFIIPTVAVTIFIVGSITIIEAVLTNGVLVKDSHCDV